MRQAVQSVRVLMFDVTGSERGTYAIRDESLLRAAVLIPDSPAFDVC
jgi:hypothetical protein